MTEKSNEVRDRIVGVLQGMNPNIPKDQITPGTLLIGDLNIDSLKIAELSVLLEDQFKVPVFVPELFSQVDDPYDLNVHSLEQLVLSKLAACTQAKEVA